MSSLTTIQGSDLISSSRTDINNNFTALNNDKMETSVLDTDTTLAANSDAKVATQKAVKAYVDANGFGNASTTGKGVVQEATQAQVAAGTTSGDTGARLFVNPGSLTTKFPVSSAFSGASPTSYTDLDLSSIVGARSAVVLLKVVCGAVGVEYYFRKNGETGQHVNNGNASGTAKTQTLANTNIGYVIVPTDSAGVIEWKSAQAGAAQSSTTTVTVEAYW